ncbi:hypothetical protein [Latilactobacillus curvatus]|uniref:hypothetical protein n=1 Tax=Latilactobacillus curvatus TaxID=28038 RepID=UPI000FECDF1F|nr:hypothetical protein [Latilactobacillus curvatus]QAR35273.1 hypothetical protein EQK21_04100 [Latilactobacillus curvatus]
MEIKTTSLEYKFDNEGSTKSIAVSLTGNDGTDYVNANMAVTTDDLGDGQTFDDLTKKDITTIAKVKLAKATAQDAPKA